MSVGSAKNNTNQPTTSVSPDTAKPSAGQNASTASPQTGFGGADSYSKEAVQPKGNAWDPSEPDPSTVSTAQGVNGQQIVQTANNPEGQDPDVVRAARTVTNAIAAGVAAMRARRENGGQQGAGDGGGGAARPTTQASTAPAATAGGQAAAPQAATQPTQPHQQQTHQTVLGNIRRDGPITGGPGWWGGGSPGHDEH